MFENNTLAAKQAYAVETVSRSDRTIGENIDAKINVLQFEIDRLQLIKKQMREGMSLLDMKSGDIRRAMD